jgi:hypothetical protein
MLIAVTVSSGTFDRDRPLPEVEHETVSHRYRLELAGSITVFGRSLPEQILGHLSFGDMAFLELTARTPTADKSRMFNAMLVTLVEHGLTPNTLVARLI